MNLIDEQHFKAQRHRVDGLHAQCKQEGPLGWRDQCHPALDLGCDRDWCSIPA